MLVCRESPRQPDLLVLIESSPAIERLTVIIVNFLLQQPFGFGKTLVLHIARCPALSRQYQQQCPQQPHDPLHGDTSQNVRIWPAYGARPFQKVKSADSFLRLYKIIYIYFSRHPPRKKRPRQNINKKGPIASDGPFPVLPLRGNGIK